MSIQSHIAETSRDIEVKVAASLCWLENQGYLPTMVTVVNIKSEEETIELPKSELAQIFGHSRAISEDAMNEINMMLYIKDWYVSDSAYHELAKVCSQMPRQYKLKERISELNKLWEIRPTPNNTHGVQQSLKDRLKIRLRHLIASSPESASFMQNKTIHVKLSGDGTKIGKRLHVVAFTFTLLDENQACSAAGNHVLAVFKQPESYDCLKLALEDIIKEVEELTEVFVDGINFKVVYYLGGNWKFLAMVTGINAASSDHACT